MGNFEQILFLSHGETPWPPLKATFSTDPVCAASQNNVLRFIAMTVSRGYMRARYLLLMAPAAAILHKGWSLVRRWQG